MMNRLNWLGKVPERWNVLKLRQILTPFSEKNHPNMPLLSVVREKGVIIRNIEDKEENHNYVPDDLSGYKLVKKGQFAMNKMKAWQGSYGISKYDGIVSPAYFVFDINHDMNKDFFNLAIRSKVYVNYFGQASDGIRVGQWDLSMKRMKEIPFFLPPRSEQDQIVKFLDWKVSCINKLISVKKKQFLCIQEFINKQYQVISHNSHKQAKLKYYTHLSNDFFLINNNEYYKKTGMYNRGRGIFRREAILGEHMGDSSFQRIYAGCVMISGQFAWEGSAYVTTKEDEQGVASHRYYLLVPNSDVPAEYIWCFLMSDYGQMQMKLCSHGAAGRNRPLNIKELLNIYFPIPVRDKELDSLVHNVRGLMKLRSSTLNSVRNLAELRTRIINEVITGKIDIRNIEIPEYEFVEEEIDSDVTDSENEEGSEE